MVAEFVDDLPLREEIRDALKIFCDLERIAGRAGAGAANPKELLDLGDSLLRLNYLAALAKQGKSTYFQALQHAPPETEELGEKVVDSFFPLRSPQRFETKQIFVAHVDDCMHM